MKKDKQTNLRSIDLPIKSEPRVPINITLTAEDKQFLKLYAIKHGTNVSAIISEYVKYLRDADKQ